MLCFLHGMADHHLLPDQRQVDAGQEQRGQGETPRHLAIDGEAAQQRAAAQ